MNKLLTNIYGIVELGGILALTGIALKRNNDCYKAKRDLIIAEQELECYKMNTIVKDFEIERLTKELRKTKTK